MSQLPQTQPTVNTIPIDRLYRVREPILITAVKASQLAQVQALIDEGADVNISDTRGWTPLHHAAHLGDESIAFSLIHSGANIEARNGFFETPLILAAAGVNSFDMVQYLLECGANIDAEDDEGHSIRFFLTRQEMVCCRNL